MDDLDEREATEAMTTLARWARTFYLNLTAEGFTAPEALALTQTWMRTNLSQAKGD